VSVAYTLPSLSLLFKKEYRGSWDTKKEKTYNSGYSPVVTHLTTNPPVDCLSTAERTGSSVLSLLWSYVEGWLGWKGYDVGGGGGGVEVAVVERARRKKRGSQTSIFGQIPPVLVEQDRIEIQVLVCIGKKKKYSDSVENETRARQA
jgi:hypothetical protein